MIVILKNRHNVMILIDNYGRFAEFRFDMSGDRQTAKLAVGRPLDGREG
jgi:hypothetical protein